MGDTVAVTYYRWSFAVHQEGLFVRTFAIVLSYPGRMLAHSHAMENYRRWAPEEAREGCKLTVLERHPWPEGAEPPGAA